MLSLVANLHCTCSGACITAHALTPSSLHMPWHLHHTLSWLLSRAALPLVALITCGFGPGARLVLTNGTTVDVSSKHHPDLLWAVQGASKLSAYPCQSDELIHRWRRWFSCSSVVRLSAISSYTACVLQAAERVGCIGSHQMANLGSSTGALAVAYLLSACSTVSVFTFLPAAICFMARMPHHRFRHGIRRSIQVPVYRCTTVLYTGARLCCIQVHGCAESHVAVLYLLQLLPTP